MAHSKYYGGSSSSAGTGLHTISAAAADIALDISGKGRQGLHSRRRNVK